MGAISKLWETFEMVSGTKGRGFESRIARIKDQGDSLFGLQLALFICDRFVTTFLGKAPSNGRNSCTSQLRCV